jgi:cytosine/adenosine deaminase-related metal-dependent hydrolase
MLEVLYQRVLVTGARWAAEHFGPRLGAIVPGAPADLVLVDYRPATEFSSDTLLDHLWAGLLRAPVSGVMVSGEILMDNGHLVSVDEREVAARARSAERVWGGRVGAAPPDPGAAAPAARYISWHSPRIP